MTTNPTVGPCRACEIVGWIQEHKDGRKSFYEGDLDPRDVHDNGMPTYPVYRACRHRDEGVRVPREPTIEMENAGDKADRDYSNNRFHGKGHLGRVAFIYDAMLAAAPKTSDEGAGRAEGGQRGDALVA